MTEISDLIEFENENSILDFKAIQYKREMYESFLKDIMSLANSISKDDRFIITGVKHMTNGSRNLLGILETFIDDATYQQLVDSNIEPHINFSYFPYNYDGKIFGVFHIKDCDNPPYMMKKDYGNLKIGDSYIRKGSSQKRLTRKDIDNHYLILKKNDISKDIQISLSDQEIINEIKIERSETDLPSKINKKRIEEIIKQKERELRDDPYPFYRLFQPPSSNLYGTSYENRDLATLRTNLENIEKTYEEKDQYYLNEKSANKLNIFIHNNSTEFLEEASIEISIPHNSDRYFIRDSIFREPYSTHPLIPFTPRSATWEELNYPSVEIKRDSYKIYEEIGNIKHKLPLEALKVPLRLVIIDSTNEFEIEIDVKIFARNIENPIYQKLKIKL